MTSKEGGYFANFSVLSVVCDNQENSYCPMALRPILDRLDDCFVCLQQTRVPSGVLPVALAVVEGWNHYFSVTSSYQGSTTPAAAEGLSGLCAMQNGDVSCYETQMSPAKRISQLWIVKARSLLYYRWSTDSKRRRFQH